MNHLGQSLCFTAAVAMLIIAALTDCGHQGLARSAADGALDGCTEWAQTHQDAELLVLCQGGKPLTVILDLFAARQQQATARDAGADR